MAQRTVMLAVRASDHPIRVFGLPLPVLVVPSTDEASVRHGVPVRRGFPVWRTRWRRVHGYSTGNKQGDGSSQTVKG